MFAPLFRSKSLGGKREKLCAKNQYALEVTKGVNLRTLPTIHSVSGRNSGVGLVFDIQPKKSRLVITGDTAWNDKIEARYHQLRHPQTILVAHVSTVCREEVLGVLFGDKPGFYSKHLGMRGLCRVIEALRPAHVVLSEIGEELRDSVSQLAKLVESYYPCKCTIGWPDYPCHFPVQPVKWYSSKQPK